ncbi:MAG: hypothetical protein ACRD0D_00825 [Acidimicrobiales bacterium]
MDKLTYLLLGPFGCVAGMAVWMAMVARRRRRPDPRAEPAPADEVGALRADVAHPVERTEANGG